MIIVRAMAGLATASVLALAPTAAFAASSDDYTVVSPPTQPGVNHPAVLPNTGSEPWMKTAGAAGVLLVLGGGGVVLMSRRRKTAHA